jgi:oligoribonuclease
MDRVVRHHPPHPLTSGPTFFLVCTWARVSFHESTTMSRLWIDLESTDLDPRKGHLLEVAVVATDETADYVERAHQTWVLPWSDASYDETLSPGVREMHTRSGLLADCKNPAVYTDLVLVDAQLLRFLMSYGYLDRVKNPIAGSSAHFDKGWLDVHLPRSAKAFNHRVFDASTLTQFAKDLGLDPAGPGNPDSKHRALDDIRYSIEAARRVARLVKQGPWPGGK